MAHRGIAERDPVGVEGGRLDHVAAAGHRGKGPLDEGVRIGREQALRQVPLLGEEEPVEGLRRSAVIDGRHGVESRYHREQRECRDPSRMIERQTIAGARAAVVTDDAEAVVAETAHQ